ncbi:phosphoserine phosphatase [Candidatus Kinetoplastibacterium desouzaii TCC079E]|uniref:Histidinol-phosphatase n=1 Tax=Candidatus Kinetoplastidibacterium desouzai TCC079E TaxID=1208919 RepID=M1LUZ7_9PROT|nr:HAD family hydrolase [Candidatus Kinetoplastibacterium desouzaii]AGF47109.1 phosphoserine phosphatase [Candidatus Kinetoplastibacterium desouzaii TCC079E]
MHNNLALFDLDHTLLPIDSDYQWTMFLANNGRTGKNPEEAIQQNNDLMNKYNQGELSAKESVKFMLGLLKPHTPFELSKWHEEFMMEIIRPSITEEAISLVKTHLEQGDLCAIVTATNNFVTEPIARAFGIKKLIATEAEYVNGKYTGNVIGIPSFKEGKITRVNQWLSSIGYDINSFTKSYFYSDSINDLPLLEKVTDPVATNPSNNLRSIAKNRNWKIIDIFKNLKDNKS